MDFINRAHTALYRTIRVSPPRIVSVSRKILVLNGSLGKVFKPTQTLFTGLQNNILLGDAKFSRQIQEATSMLLAFIDVQRCVHWSVSKAGDEKSSICTVSTCCQSLPQLDAGASHKSEAGQFCRS